MEKYICTNCGFIYEPEKGDATSGVPAGTGFKDLPEDWICPVCYVGKDKFDLL